jgi:hypothetical protein
MNTLLVFISFCKSFRTCGIVVVDVEVIQEIRGMLRV